MSTRILDIKKGPSMPVVLFVDDEASNRQAFQAAFRKAFQVITAANLEEAWEPLSNERVDVVISDQRMPGASGHELLALVREKFPKVRRMLVTGYTDIQAIIDAVNMGGISRYFSKPWVASEVIGAVKEAFTEIQQERDREAYGEQLLESNKQLEFALRQRLLS